MNHMLTYFVNLYLMAKQYHDQVAVVAAVVAAAVVY